MDDPIRCRGPPPFGMSVCGHYCCIQYGVVAVWTSSSPSSPLSSSSSCSTNSSIHTHARTQCWLVELRATNVGQQRVVHHPATILGAGTSDSNATGATSNNINNVSVCVCSQRAPVPRGDFYDAEYFCFVFPTASSFHPPNSVVCKGLTANRNGQ